MIGSLTPLPIDDEHYVVRYAGERKIDDGMPQAAAFELRDGEPDYSVNWIEYFIPNSVDESLSLIRANRFSSSLSLNAKAKFLKLNVGRIRKEIVARVVNIEALDVIHSPEIGNLSHSGIFGADTLSDIKQREVAMELCELVEDQYPARG